MKPEVLLVTPMMTHVEAALDEAYRVHRLFEAEDRTAFLEEVGPGVRGAATMSQASAVTLSSATPRPSISMMANWPAAAAMPD